MSIGYRYVIISAMSKLRDIREKKAISLKELSTKSGVSINTLSRIERGQRKPQHVTRQKIAQALGMAPEDIDF